MPFAPWTDPPEWRGPLWANGAGQSQIAFGLPTDAGHPVYRRLVSSPGLRATIVVDMRSRHILRVTFRGKA
jgi:hypothetical protein